jgi:hypothetical protein
MNSPQASNELTVHLIKYLMLHPKQKNQFRELVLYFAKCASFFDDRVVTNFEAQSSSEINFN